MLAQANIINKRHSREDAVTDVRKIQILREWVERIGTTELPIVVEGPKDKQALEVIGAREVFTLSRKPLFAIAEEVASNLQ